MTRDRLLSIFFFSSRRRHTRSLRDWSSDVCSSDLGTRIVVDPFTRIEGHLRIEVNVDKDNVIRNAVSTGTMWRGLEVILKGRDPRDARSEERRVGKEWRARWSPEPSTTKRWAAACH